jgi:hypothetical protein
LTQPGSIYDGLVIGLLIAAGPSQRPGSSTDPRATIDQLSSARVIKVTKPPIPIDIVGINVVVPLLDVTYLNVIPRVKTGAADAPNSIEATVEPTSTRGCALRRPVSSFRHSGLS